MQSGVDLFSRPPSKGDYAGENEDENEVDRNDGTRNDGDSLDRMRRYRLTDRPLD